MRLILAFFASILVRVLRATWRVRLLGPDPFLDSEKNRVFCFWHGKQLGLFAHPQRRSLVILTSLSRDGILQSKILERLGFKICRGSSSRHGAAGLKALIGAMDSGLDGAFAVDGPRGPAYKVKPGAIFAAKKSRATLVPITTRYSSSWTFVKAWDNYAIPKPFSRIDIIRGKGISACSESIGTLTDKLEKSLLSLDDSLQKKEEKWEASSILSSG